MRILHTNMLRGWGGQSNRIFEEAIGAHRAGHEVKFAIPDGSKLAEKAAAAGMEVWPGFSFKPPAQVWKFLPDLLRLRRHLKHWKPDLVHVHGSQDSWLVVVLKSLGGISCPVIRTKHNIFDWKTHGMNRWLYGKMDAYVSISGYIDRQVAEYPSVKQTIPRALIPSVPDLEKIRQQYDSIRGELPGLKPGMFLWGSTGRLRWEKGWDVLLKAFRRVRDQRTDAYLIIAGDGSDRDALAKQAAELNLGPEALAFLGFRKDVPAILQSLDGYVLASRSEGLGTAILEALATGLPVVATNVGGIPDSVHHQETGLLAASESDQEIAAAMLRLMDDEDLRRRLGENARRLIETEFTRDQLVSKTLAFYQEVIERYS